MTQTNNLSKKQEVTAEVFNAITHGAAAALSLVAIVLLVMKGVEVSSPIAITAYIIYGASLFTLFLNSTLYHSFSFSKYKAIFQKLDHASIYLLIAGTYTPYLMISIGGIFGYSLLSFIWILAIAGIAFEVVATDKFPKLSTYMYLGLGWLGVVIIYPLYHSIEVNGLFLLALGGIIYSLGTIFYRMKSNKWMHVIWHLFVIGGALFMFISIYRYV
ncbi:hemolysin III family protein [Aerococcaceae bacterium DSM 109653]|uniref:Hemolysin III family protein n=1 Tax=Fundicoccus ignavus TaxID=2664442 RepID=A0A844BQT4_9LACT|nr:hemolysin III family protein [Fundicoccus ignavus]MRI80432.1 hemolysin III family protein [Fundicoccus ignavus]